MVARLERHPNRRPGGVDPPFGTNAQRLRLRVKAAETPVVPDRQDLHAAGVLATDHAADRRVGLDRADPTHGHARGEIEHGSVVLGSRS